MSELPKDFVDFCKSITAKRAKTVIDHILKYGFITTEELKEKYGYNHPPRAVRDVREHGIPLKTYRVTGSDGRKIAAYKFDITEKFSFKKLSGRTGFSKKIKEALIEKYGAQCFIYREKMDAHELQIDHRVPYEVGGDSDEINPEDFMLLCSSANRAKSWYCEHCENWNSLKERSICLKCYWAYPENYSRIGMNEIRRIDLIWKGKEVEIYEDLRTKARELGKEIPVFIKEIIQKELSKKN